MVFHWSLSDSKSPQVSRTRLSILGVLSNTVVWIVSTRPPTSKSSRPFNNPLVTVPNAIIIIIIIRAFHISVSQWLFTGVWETTSLLKSLGLFSVFWPFSTMLSFGWSPPVRQLPSPPVPFSNPLVTIPNAPITVGIIVTCMFYSFFQFPSKVEVLILLFTFFKFYFVVSRNRKVDNFASSLFCCWLLLSLVFWLGLGDPFVC